jgi:hypothetical protein
MRSNVCVLRHQVTRAWHHSVHLNWVNSLPTFGPVFVALLAERVGSKNAGTKEKNVQKQKE